MHTGCRRSLRFLISIFILLMLSLGCSMPDPKPPLPTPAPALSPAPVQSAPAPAAVPEAAPLPLSAWGVYWDSDPVIKELEILSPSLSSISAFSMLFDAQDGMYLPDQTIALIWQLQEAFGQTKEIYLTFVNDVALEDGGFSLKDVGLLERIFANDAAMDAHIADMIALTQAAGCGGIDLDYEAVKRNATLWEPYGRFIEKLYARAGEANLSLRVVLEPASLGKTAYPNGPEYVVMCYNLYGSHSGPGPKADMDFIRELAQKSSGISDIAFAFATGGFDWKNNKDAQQLTQSDAEALAKRVGATPVRDTASGAMQFTYKEDNVPHTVWYADGETLAFWIHTAREAGIMNFALWRTGGNAEEALKRVLEAAQP